MCTAGDGRRTLQLRRRWSGDWFRVRSQDLSGEPVPDTRHGFDAIALAQGPSQQRDLLRHVVLLNDDVRPQRVHERFLGHHRACVLHEQDEKLECLGGEGDGLAGAVEPVPGGIETELAEDIHRACVGRHPVPVWLAS